MRKGVKPLDEPSSYQPLCMLNSMTKLLEKIVDDRIQGFLENIDGLFDFHYGSKKRKSTVDAVKRLTKIADHTSATNIIGMFTLDVKNAFNFTHWRKKVQVQLLNILSNYFRDRMIIYEITYQLLPAAFHKVHYRASFVEYSSRWVTTTQKDASG